MYSLKNLYAAFGHVKKNKGKAGLDRVSIKQFETNLEVNMVNIHQELKTALYQPSPVLRVYIPKGRYKFVRYADDFMVMTKTKEELPPPFSTSKKSLKGSLE